MNHLIYQYFKTDKDRTLVASADFNYVNLSLTSVSKYAQRHNHNFHFESNVTMPFSSFYGIFLPFLDGSCWDYDSVCFLDCDILISNKSEDIYKYSSMEHINVFVQPSLQIIQPSQHDNRFDFFKNEMNGWANSGVVIFPKAIYNDLIYFLRDLPEYYGGRYLDYPMTVGFFDQYVVNEFIRQTKQWHALPEKFNYIHGHPDLWHVVDSSDAYFHHFHRDQKQAMKEEFHSGKYT